MAICIEFDVVAYGESRNVALANLEEAIEKYLDVEPNSIRVEPVMKKV